ncbi:hypothetical protein FRE64_08830 [Euhalothece natronophila Z-M001]|uniref:DUF4935 domain-containing protein n=1 Tax=Euhalothece natronophila Z-M001 TaxID=522448 RepID=A0A5B8NL74_9CHRO|nr:PIN domain-containing protein [Euhalothece natronophila]QDZ40033.1 hypothetical protein FRE64_08830 [Euhalothece natronophila Z-M001]
MDRYLIIDTCVWIKLAGEPKFYTLLETLSENIEKTDSYLILPESVKIEFERHRDKIKANWTKKCKSWIGQLKDIKRHFPDHSDSLLDVHNNLQNDLKKLDTNIEQNLKIIDSLFQRALIDQNCSDEFFSEAGRRVFNRIPPAINSKSSSVGDCLLWLCVIRKLKEGEVWFCTDNKNDFSDPKYDFFPHAKLDQEAFKANKGNQFNYFIDPTNFIDKIGITKKKLPKYYDYVEDKFWIEKPILCPKCKHKSAFPRLYPTGYMYVCVQCKEPASTFIPSDDPFL